MAKKSVVKLNKQTSKKSSADSKNKQELKKSKKLRTYLIIIFSILGAGLIVIICLLATKTISCSTKKDPETSSKTIHIYQPDSDKWELTVNDKKEDLKANQNDKLNCVVKEKTNDTNYVTNDTNYVTNDAVIYYIVVRPLSGGSANETYPFELSYDSNQNVYSCDLTMYWSFDISISIKSSSDYEASYYSKDKNGNVNYVYNNQTLFDSSYSNIVKTNVIDFTKTEIKRDEFNEEIWVGNKLTAVLPGFLGECKKFNSPIHFENNTKITEIEDWFMWDCIAFNQALNFPDSLKTIGGDFLYECTAFNQPFNTKNIQTLASSTSTTTFMYKCEAFNSEFTIGSSLTNLPHNFLAYCKSFNKDLVIPSNIKSIQTGFMVLCDNMVSTITIDCPYTAFSSISGSEDVCSTDNGLAPCYQQGIKINGQNADQFKQSFPDISIESGNKMIRKLVPTNK